MKRKPLLIDEFLALTSKHVPSKWWASCHTMQQRLRKAKVFRFEEEAACHAAHMMMEHPEAIAHDVDFATPPYECMYIEFPYPKFFGITSSVERAFPPIPPDEEDMDVGYFYDGPMVYVLSRANPKANYKYPMVLPVRYRLNQPLTDAEDTKIVTMLGGMPNTVDLLLWGSCYKKLHDQPDTLHTLRKRHGVEFWYGEQEVSMVALAHTLRTSAGDLRNIVAFPLFLNRTREVAQALNVPPAHGFIHSKQRMYVPHTEIRLTLDPGPLLRRLFQTRASGGWRRDHDVRGHWCHDATYHAAQHQHDMKQLTKQHWQCTLCGGLRWWRREHHRGHGAEVGGRRYEVTK